MRLYELGTVAVRFFMFSCLDIYTLFAQREAEPGRSEGAGSVFREDEFRSG